MAETRNEAWYLKRSLRRAERRIAELEDERAKLHERIAGLFVVLAVLDANEVLK